MNARAAPKQGSSSEPGARFRRILIALDETPVAVHAMEVGAGLAKALCAEIGLLHVIDTKDAKGPEGSGPPLLVLEKLRQEGHRLLKTASSRLGSDPPPWEYLVEGNAHQEIVRTAEGWKADLIVLGTRHRSRIASALLGSTADWVLHHSKVPVLVVPLA